MWLLAADKAFFSVWRSEFKVHIQHDFVKSKCYQVITTSQQSNTETRSVLFDLWRLFMFGQLMAVLFSFTVSQCLKVAVNVFAQNILSV